MANKEVYKKENIIFIQIKMQFTIKNIPLLLKIIFYYYYIYCAFILRCVCFLTMFAYSIDGIPDERLQNNFYQ